jgi:UDP-N-acetylmuramate dehydrogenase
MPEILKDVSLSEKTKIGYKIGGCADFYLSAYNAHDLKYGIAFAKEKNIPFFILVNGTNVLVRDKGYRGIVINTQRMDEIIVSGNSIKAGCGAAVTSFVREAILANFAGVEELSGIPGTVGGAITMNAGAYSQAISDKISQIHIYDCDNDLEHTISRESAQFEYRSSVFRKKNYIVLRAEFHFTLKVSYGILAARQNEILRKRKEYQPLEYNSCGSVFRNPLDNYAGKLIDEAGLKGFSAGGAQVSEKHANFIVNKGRATAEDVRKVIGHVRKTVQNNSSELLEPELIFLGEFDTDI